MSVKEDYEQLCVSNTILGCGFVGNFKDLLVLVGLQTLLLKFFPP